MATEQQHITFAAYYRPVQQDVFNFGSWAGIGVGPLDEAPDHGLWPISSILEHISPAELKRLVDLQSPPSPSPPPTTQKIIIQAALLPQHPSEITLTPAQFQDQRRRHQCPVCRKFFTQASSLRVHGRIHTGEKPFQCEICQKSFNQSGSLRLHRTVHSNERPFHCDVCKKSFSRVRSLRLHMKTHSGHKPYKCDTCDKAFTMKSNLRIHQKIHDDTRPFTCDVCHKTFERHETLVHHSRIHRAVKPFECEVCEKRFPTPQSLGSHQKTHEDGSNKSENGETRPAKKQAEEEEEGEDEEEKVYQCDECPKSFSSPGSLRAHRRSHDRRRKKLKRGRGLRRH